MSKKKKTIQYYGLKDFAEFATQEGIEVNDRILSVYKGRGTLPEPAVMIGTKSGWSKEQIDEWIKERKSQ